MVMIKSLFLTGLMFAVAKCTTSTTKPAMATLQVQPNFDFSLTRKEFRVHYSGLGDDFIHQSGDPVTIKIYKQDDTVFHNYEIDEQNKNQKKAYYFALNGAEDGEYKVEVCSGSTCSGKTTSLTKIESKQIQLTCVKGSKGKDSEGYETWTTSQQFSIDFKGPVASDWINPSDLETIENELNTALQKAGSSTKYQTLYKKHKFTANPSYKPQEQLFYAAMRYDVAQYKELFDKSIGPNEQRSEYSHDKCKRKYILSAHVHLVNDATKEVKYRFKTTLHLSGFGKQYFIMADEAKDGARKVHVEMFHEKAVIAVGTYKIHVIFCATEKDEIESTYCADPVIRDEDFVVKSDQE